MNDRTSAAPPVFFLGTEAAAAAAAAEADIHGAPRHPKLPFGFEKTVPAATAAVVEEPVLVKRGSKQFLGQVWDGVLEKFRFGSSRKDTHAVAEEERPGHRSSGRRKKGAVVPEAAAPVVAKPKRSSGREEDERPSKEEVYANYHHLVASGFFSSHAIQSTRQPGPTNASSSLAPPSPAKKTSASTTPQWPLTPQATTPVRPSPVQSPHSATSSRGKKRPSISMADDDDDDDQHTAAGNGGGGGAGLHVKKLRKTASTINRDLSVPRTRSASRTMGLRSFSNAVRVPSLTVDERLGQQPRREPNKLVKRVPSKLPTDEASAPLRRSSSSTRRNASESHNSNNNNHQHHHQHHLRASHDEARHVLVVPAAPQQQQEGSTRVLRPRRSAAEPLRVRPDANRGIPTVPDIPVKFTYGEDRENDGPWKGLRRTRAA